MSKLDTRDEILLLVRRGAMTPESAERWAKENREIFATEPDPLLFNPFIEDHWTLSMIAAWIEARSIDAVRNQWEPFRVEFYSWTPIEGPDETDVGFELQPRVPRSLLAFSCRDDDFADLDEFDPIGELAFALQSGQLVATGLRASEKTRSSILKSDWLAAAPTSTSVHRGICAAVESDIFYRDVLIPRDEVLGIWVPRTIPSAKGLPRSVEAEPRGVQLKATLRPDFYRPDWNVEHVISWIRYRDLAQLHDLGQINSRRPKWYGRLCRDGLVDADAEVDLRTALITEKLVGMNQERPVPGGWWRGRSFTNDERMWFRKDAVLEVWPELNGPAPISAPDGAAKAEKTTLGRKPKKANQARAAMMRDIESRDLSIEELRDMSGKQLQGRYNLTRTSVSDVRKKLMSEFDANTNSDN